MMMMLQHLMYAEAACGTASDAECDDRHSLPTSASPLYSRTCVALGKALLMTGGQGGNFSPLDWNG